MNSLLQKQLDTAIASLTVLQKSKRSQWRTGLKGVREQFPTIESINEHYERLIAEKRREYEEKNTALTAHKITTVESTSDRIEAPVESTRLDLTEDDKSVQYYTSPLQTAVLRNWQQRAVNAVYDKLIVENKPAVQLISGVGTGKTWMDGNLFRRMIDEKCHLKFGCMSPFPYLYVTRAPVVEQVKRVFTYEFGIKMDREEVIVTNYEQLRSKWGGRFISFETIIKDGEPDIVIKWNPILIPFLILWDESHSLNNEGSLQSRVAQSINLLKLDRCKQIFQSATPYIKVADGKCFATATRAQIDL